MSRFLVRRRGVEAGQTVVVKFADQTFTAQVQQDGSWHLTVPASAMETLIDGRAQVSVSVTNLNGNSADAFTRGDRRYAAASHYA